MMFLMRKILYRFKKDKTGLFCLYVVFAFLFMGFVLSYFLSSPYEVHEDFLTTPPFWMEGGSLKFLLGTDDLGRDLFIRLAHGARLSILIGSGVVFLSLIVGSILGLLAGYFGGFLDNVIMRCVDALMSFPSILIAILIVAILGPGLWNAVIAVNVVAWPSVIRVVRSVVLKEREKDYIEAVRGFGAKPFRILVFNILPNCTAPLVVQGVLGFSEGILNVAALGFLGLGAEPPLPEWGLMIGDSRAYMESAWWMVTFPGLFLFALVLSVNVVGESLRDALDPKTVM